MKTTKTVTQPAKDYETLDKLVCELCGKETTDDERWPPTTSSYSTNKVTIERETGENYGPDGGNIQKVVIDLCPECFVTKLIPWIESQGGKSRKEESDW